MTLPYEIVKYDQIEHFSMIRSWWKGWGKTAPHHKMLSDFGLIIKEDVFVAATWLYFSNSGIGQLGFTVSNPEVGGVRRVKGTIRLIDISLKTLKESGIRFFHGYSDNKTLTKIYQDFGANTLSKHDFLIKDLETNEWDSKLY